MPSSKLVKRAGGLFAAAILASSLIACAAEPEMQFVSPTMAPPEQTLSEACAISGEEVDRLTIEVEQQIRDALARAASELASGQAPSIQALSGSLDSAIAEIEAEISNAEVLASVAKVRESLQGFGEITTPDSALGIPGYLTSLSSQVNEVVDAGKSLQSLCSTN